MADSHTISAVSQDTTILAVESGSFDPQTTTDIFRQAGSVIPGAVHIKQHQPMATFTVADIAAAISAFPLSGSEIGVNPLVLETVVRTSGGGLGSTGVTISIDDGLVVPSTLSASQGEVATIEYNAYGGGSGVSTNPVSIATGAAPSDVTSAAQNQYTVGQVSLGTSIGMVQSINLNFEANINHVHGDGGIYPALVSIGGWEISGTVETLTSDALDGPDEGDTTSLTMTLNKRSETGIADTGSISISFPGSTLTVLDSVSGNKGDNVSTTLSVNAVHSDYSTFPVSTA